MGISYHKCFKKRNFWYRTIRTADDISDRLTDKLQSYKTQVARVITDADYFVLTPIDELSSKLDWSSLEEKQTDA